MNIENLKTATFANGCFWCTEAVFQRLKGVSGIESGFTGGAIKNPPYREVVQGRTGHAEAIQLKYDSKFISYEELLLVFFTTHDPTTLNRQGNDIGTQYRSAIFYHSEEQKNIAEQVVRQLNETVFKGKIVTEITEASAFYSAEFDHQNFYNNNPNQPYCQYIIDPKINKLKTYFSDKMIDSKV
ncbi:peptide-methionine (S)-S-oxide reductase MsrA [Mesonia aestuariivivens]|uniref:Peptide methionine sulfoxide reductase MsrA n=1 Tax=Mesonia aestuariivivens TaxID=2796128 RepID=A0ABS6W4H7_9FLAO|nr:peptide-methionine (S)-S-oxide reductase MsrA [Mesonia aestuariivivens]MBW2962782.1 peptide-methionine (S)-S-oxide reductase MsrA [Mesonia aestuariivivens]